MTRSTIAIFVFSLSMLAGCRKKVDTDIDLPPRLEPPVETRPKPVPVEEPIKQIALNFTRVNFEFDASTLTASAKSALSENARLLNDNPGVRVEISGHADERGSTDYNVALGDRRANTVREFLIRQGVAPSRLTAVSFGEERPLVVGETETAWAENRRAEFRITSQADGS